ncbi:MAG: ABC transporter ATP-binding protein/permease [Lachnospiraceae bacterium]|nr:ABC transporter ATP-binding protein/permease [Lachnospiraceae bacterium]
MLQLKSIVKDYKAGDNIVKALKGIDITFRKHEFVSVLGPSGCGKTTLLNIVGGLDKYTKGDLIINGKSTKKFRSRDWDSYRNHSIGFVFQNYNLIPHQTVLSNVELALTLSGVTRSERKQRAKDVLEKVGLGDQLYKKPNQMSGGQMQRVAIARALVNDPDILLADEPTGALDTKTSAQIMEILKEISKDRLIIMVTHNPELAEQYSSRIIKLLDGKVIDDSKPYTEEEMQEDMAKHPSHYKHEAQKKVLTGDSDIATGKKIESENAKHKRKKTKKSRTSMSFITALTLSFKNLLTKKGRTFLTSFAGSIGIIGIALILSLSNGIQDYIDRIQEETLSSYPLTIMNETVDMSSLMETFASTDKDSDKDKKDKKDKDSKDKKDKDSKDKDSKKKDSKSKDDKKESILNKVYSRAVMMNMMKVMVEEKKSNDLKKFKKFIDGHEDMDDYVNAVQYSYGIVPRIYMKDTQKRILRVNPSDIYEQMGMQTDTSAMSAQMISSSSSNNSWVEMIDNERLLKSQYEVVAGKWPKKYNEVVLVVTENNEIADAHLYALGLKESKDLSGIMKKLMKGDEVEFDDEDEEYTYKEILGLEYKVVLPCNTYKYNKSLKIWEDKSSDKKFMMDVIEDAVDLRISAIIRPKEDSVSTAMGAGSIGYTKELTEYIIKQSNKSKIVKQQKKNEEVDVFSGIEFDFDAKNAKIGMKEIKEYVATLPDEERAQMEGYMAMMTEEQIIEQFSKYVTLKETDATYETNLDLLCAADIKVPKQINIYPKDFASKEAIEDLIKDYNDDMKADGKEDSMITYTDIVGVLMSAVTDIIDIISYVLIAFVSISLVVSSIMIGIITYISVLERTKEIGILRSIGASKRDISRVFNAETLIVGFSAGAIGIGVTILLNIPANMIIKSLTGIDNISKLPPVGGIALVLISMFLTFIAGLVPSRYAAKKDPVVALRSE